MTIAGRFRWRRHRVRDGGHAAADRDNVAPADDRNSAFANLYERLFADVYRYCRRRLDDPDEAEDAAALVFANAFAAFPPERPEAARSWLFAIAHNVVANQYRIRQVRGLIRPLDAALAVPDTGASPEDAACAADERRRLGDALARLSPDQRRVVELRLAGLTGPEIAAVLGRSHAAVKMLQLRAVDRLRALLATPVAPGTGARTEEDTHGRRSG